MKTKQEIRSKLRQLIRFGMSSEVIIGILFDEIVDLKYELQLIKAKLEEQDDYDKEMVEIAEDYEADMWNK